MKKIINLSSIKKRFNKSFFYSWEMILVYFLILINLLLMIALPETYFYKGSIQTIIRSGMDLSIMVLGMIFILILGEIDVSIASIMVLSSMVMGLSYQSGLGTFLSVFLGIICGAVCGAINGLLITYGKMSSVIVTIATGLLYKGIVRAVLKDTYLNTFPDFFVDFAWNDIGGFMPVSLVIFIVFAIIFGIVLHKSKFGRELYMIGSNKEAARYSGVNVNLVKIVAFIIMGITASLSGILFVGRFDGITFSVGGGYELKVIAIVVLGGVSTLGGKGKIYGPIIATLFMAFLVKTLDLLQIHPNVVKIAIGLVLIVAVLIPRIDNKLLSNIKEKFLSFAKIFKKKEQKNEEK